MFASKDAIFSSAAAGPFSVSNSLRFRSSASAYLNRTFTTPTSSTVYTLSLWVKRGALGTTQNLFGASTTTRLGFNTSDQLVLVLAGTTAVTTTAVYRDPSSWYHIVYTQNGSAQTLYVNGTSVGTGTTANTVFNTAIAHQIAAANTTNYFDGYLAEINFIDGQTLTPSSFGAYGTTTGVWQPAAYTGTYGTNGFYLKFASFGTAAALGTDSSGNGNTWTVNNISITAGTTYDPMLDSPTLTSATVANFAVLNPIGKFVTGGVTVSDGNLNTLLDRTTYNNWVPATITLPTSGKYYFEAQQTAANPGPSPAAVVGLMNALTPSTTQIPTNYRAIYLGNGNKISESGSLSYGTSYSLNDIIQVAIDVDNGKIFFGKNNTWQGSADPVAGTNAAFTDIKSSGIVWYPALINNSGNTTNTVSINFGQRPFSYTAPSGYAALNAYNISAGTVTTSGSFTGNALADGPFIYLNGTPTAMTINGNAVTFGTQADKLANGFKVRTTSTSYNSTGSNTYSVSTTGAQFKYQIAQGNP